MALGTLFPALVYSRCLQAGDWRPFNRRLLRECLQLEQDDEAGRRWSAKNYPGGYTSYGSVSRMYEVSPTFDALRRKLDRHVAAFARALELDLDGRELTITECWGDTMPHRVAPGLPPQPPAWL